VAVGPATRFLQYHNLDPKEYVSTFRFGSATQTDDAEGEILETRPVPADLGHLVCETLPQYRGSITQLPPLYSAVKKAGKPLYAYARQGQEVDRDPRRVFIYSFTDETAQESQSPDRIFRIQCSGGTYIRSLARDLGESVGTLAHVVSLVRNRVGPFTLDQAIPLDQIQPTHLLPLRETLAPLPMVPLTETQILMVRQGRTLRLSTPLAAPTVAFLDSEEQVFAIARHTPLGYQPECVIPAIAEHETV
jgi:tRNA pseudouridine55 synthase